MATSVLILCGKRENAEFIEQFSSVKEEWSVRLFERTVNIIAHLKNNSVDVIIVSLAHGRFKNLENFIRFYEAVPLTPILLSGLEGQRDSAKRFIACGAQGFFCFDPKDKIANIQIVRDVVLRFRLHSQMLSRRIRAEVTLNAISDGVIGADTEGNVDFMNPAAEVLTGWPKALAKGQPIATVMSIDIDTSLGNAPRPMKLPLQPHPVELALQTHSAAGLSAGAILVKRDGSRVDIEDSVAPIIDAQGNLSGAVVVFHDVSEERAMKVKMTYLAEHDYLTRLPNRVLFQDRLEQAIRDAQRYHHRLAVLFIDLDNFKHINDSLGHAVGDQLLISAAATLNRNVRASDTVSRQGGDEFVVLLTALQVDDDVEAIATKILKAMAEGHQVNEHILHISASIGISFFPSDALNAEDLIKHADTALYEAKIKGRNCHKFFLPTMNAKAVERQRIEVDLRNALRFEQFILHYQPKVDLSSGKITGVEALVRWTHPHEGMIGPSRFIGVAEDSKLIIPLGDWVVRSACQQIQRWREQGLDNVCVAVNVSTTELSQTSYVDNILAILEETGVRPSALQLELTESVLMSDLPLHRKLLLRLKAAGLSLALDDFGTGYSSLAYLTQLPFDVLKIDQSFIRHIDSRLDNSAVVVAILAMGKILQHCMVAEGIEDALELEFLQRHGCHQGQGYLFSKPLTEHQITLLLIAGTMVLPAVYDSYS
jgi:diguanylate cyclase (GGDEF)-like protein